MDPRALNLGGDEPIIVLVLQVGFQHDEVCHVPVGVAQDLGNRASHFPHGQPQLGPLAFRLAKNRRPTSDRSRRRSRSRTRRSRRLVSGCRRSRRLSGCPRPCPRGSAGGRTRCAHGGRNSARGPILPVFRRGRLDEGHRAKLLRIILPAEIIEGDHPIQAEHLFRRLCPGRRLPGSRPRRLVRPQRRTTCVGPVLPVVSTREIPRAAVNLCPAACCVNPRHAQCYDAPPRSVPPKVAT